MKKLLASVIVGGALTIVPVQTATAGSGSCPQYENLLAAHGLPVSTFSRIMFRESGCRPAVRSRTRDTGLLQINDINLRYLRRVIGPQVSIQWLRNPDNNVRAAKAIYSWACKYHRRGCMAPWR